MLAYDGKVFAFFATSFQIQGLPKSVLSQLHFYLNHLSWVLDW